MRADNTTHELTSKDLRDGLRWGDPTVVLAGWQPAALKWCVPSTQGPGKGSIRP